MSADVQHVLNQCYNFFAFLFLLATFKGVFKLTFHNWQSYNELKFSLKKSLYSNQTYSTLLVWFYNNGVIISVLMH